MTFHQIQNDLFQDHLGDVPWKHICKLGTSTAASKLFEYARAGFDVYILHHEYQVKHYTSPWFSATDQRVYHFLKDRISQTFGVLLIIFSAKVNQLYLLFWTVMRYCVLDLTKLFADILSKNSNLDDLFISLPTFPSITNLKAHNIRVISRLVPKFVSSLDSRIYLFLILFQCFSWKILIATY